MPLRQTGLKWTLQLCTHFLYDVKNAISARWLPIPRSHFIPIVFAAHLITLFIFNVKILKLIKWPRMVDKFWAHSPTSVMPFWCPFLDPHQTTHHSNLGVWSRKPTELSPHTSGACEQCKAIHFTTWPKIQWFLHWFPTLKPGQCFTYTGFQGWPCKFKSFNLFGGILQGKEDVSQPMSLNSAHSLCNIIQFQILCTILA